MQAVIQILVLDGVPIAGLISGAFTGPADKGLYALHIVFDQHLSAAGPGSAILMLGMRHAIDGGYAFFNLLSGFGYYKTRWLADMTATRAAQIYRIGGVFFWRRLLGDAQRWLSARLPPTVRRLLPAAGSLDSDVQRGQPTPEVTRGTRLVTTAERATFAKLIAEARRGTCEWLSPRELAAAMPFAARRAAEPSRPQNYAAISARPTGGA